MKYKLNDYKKIRNFTSKVKLNYNLKHIKDLKQNVIPKQMELETLSEIFIGPKVKQLHLTTVLELK